MLHQFRKSSERGENPQYVRGSAAFRAKSLWVSGDVLKLAVMFANFACFDQSLEVGGV